MIIAQILAQEHGKPVCNLSSSPPKGLTLDCNKLVEPKVVVQVPRAPRMQELICPTLIQTWKKMQTYCKS